jgi:hypothetical protein
MCVVVLAVVVVIMVGILVDADVVELGRGEELGTSFQRNLYAHIWGQNESFYPNNQRGSTEVREMDGGRKRRR